jgi:hypothetical protein
MIAQGYEQYSKYVEDRKQNEHIAEDLTRLRDELVATAFNDKGALIDPTLAVVVYKINSCLFRGYPRRTE